jgi:hypothetical protein
MKVIHRRVRTGSAALAAGLAALALLAVPSAQACTACYVAAGGRVLVGNNEDFGNPATKVWFVPRGAGTYGRMYFGFEDLSSQGGVNEKGLWFDAFGLPSEPVATAKGEIYPGNLQDRLLADCATVAEVLEMLKRYSRAPMTRYQWMFGDRTGASAIIEGDAVLPIRGHHHRRESDGARHGGRRAVPGGDSRRVTTRAPAPAETPRPAAVRARAPRAAPGSPARAAPAGGRPGARREPRCRSRPA